MDTKRARRRAQQQRYKAEFYSPRREEEGQTGSGVGLWALIGVAHDRARALCLTRLGGEVMASPSVYGLHAPQATLADGA